MTLASNTVGDRSIGTIDDYDRLPRPIRDALKSCIHNYNPTEVKLCLEEQGLVRTLQLIKLMDKEL